jgi:broad specificity phosphatase PhoE
MSRLFLVRHGQARPFEDNSDQLSDLGIEQALRLGRYFAERKIVFHEVYCGSLERQRRTLLLISQGYWEAKLPWPSMRLNKAWNEYDATGVMQKVAPKLAEENVDFAALSEAARVHRTTSEANRYFQRMFEVLMTKWSAGELEHPEVESWAVFHTRVEAALQRILNAEGESRNVLVVSSGGPIATSVQVLMESPARMALEMNWRMRNASITEFLFSRGRKTLDLFNAVPHLDAASTTYR